MVGGIHGVGSVVIECAWIGGFKQLRRSGIGTCVYLTAWICQWRPNGAKTLDEYGYHVCGVYSLGPGLVVIAFVDRQH